MKFERFAALVHSGLPAAKAVELSHVETEPEFELLKFAIDAGAPLGPTAKSLALYQSHLRTFELELNQAQAVPKATRKLMLWLPLFGLILGELLGFNSLAAFATTAGLIGFLVALGLTYLGANITQRMLDKSTAGRDIPGASWFRLGVLLSAGYPLSDAIGKSHFPTPKNDLIELALDTGAAMDVLIAAQLRIELEEFAARKITLAKELAVRLLIPLGLTTLPAFLIFTVLPMLIGINNK